MSTKALLCGRGRSLKYYKNFAKQDFDFVCLINEFNQFIREDHDLLDFLSDLSKKSSLTQQINISTSGVDDFLLENLDVKEITCTRLRPTGESFWWREHVNTGVLSRFNRELVLQPECVAKYMQGVENSLGVAVLNLILEKGCTEVHVIGSDFYEDDYYLSHKEYDWEETSRKETQDRLKRGFDFLVKEFKNVEFNIYTCSSYQNSSSNCRVVKVK
tara:strand:+ start:199 stop:846 length:648 start_codon:yes stop_codon:yes gene_type:complete